MADIGPWMVPAHTREQAEYVARSQAELKGYQVSSLSITGGAGGMWHVLATVIDGSGTTPEAADDVQVIGLTPG